MHGLHLIADFHECRCATWRLTDAVQLLAHCEAMVDAAGLRVVGRLGHKFPAGPAGAGGVTATVLLAESHLCIHTWPELAAVTADVYVCNFSGDHSARAERLMDALCAFFEPRQVHRQAVPRGIALTTPAP